MSRQRTIAIASVCVALVAGAIAGVIRAERGDVGVVRAPDEVRDLPPLPDPADNGWTALARVPESTFDREPPGSELLDDRDGLPRVAALEDARAEIEAYAPSDAAVAAVDAALRAPRFVIACPLDDEQPCPSLVWLRAHALAATLALRDALRGFDAEALERAARMLAADGDAIRHPRSLVSAMVAEICAEQAIELAAMLGAVLGAREDATAGRDVLAAIDAVELALVSLEPDAWSVEPAITAEWIATQRLADRMEETAGRFDHARVSAVIARHHQAALDHARDPEHHAAPARPEAGRLWPLYDPVGATMLDVLVPYDTQVARFDAEARTAADRIEVARVALAAGRARTERAIEPP